MAYIFAAALVALWLVGMLTAYTMGGLIHLLLAVALLSVVLKYMSGMKQA